MLGAADRANFRGATCCVTPGPAPTRAAKRRPTATLVARHSSEASSCPSDRVDRRPDIRRKMGPDCRRCRSGVVGRIWKSDKQGATGGRLTVGAHAAISTRACVPGGGTHGEGSSAVPGHFSTVPPTRSTDAGRARSPFALRRPLRAEGRRGVGVAVPLLPGRSSLATWLRAVLAQRPSIACAASELSRCQTTSHRAQREPGRIAPATSLVRQALACAVTLLAARDRLRLQLLLPPGTDARRNGRIMKGRSDLVAPTGAHAAGDSARERGSFATRRG